MNTGRHIPYRVFGTAQFPGNPVTLREVDDLDDDAWLCRDSRDSATEDNVYFTVRNDAACDVRFFSRTAELQLCGHGLLALACHLGVGKSGFRMNASAPGDRNWQLCHRDDAIWIRMPAVPAALCNPEDNPLIELLRALELNHDRLYVCANDVWVATVPDLETLRQVHAMTLQVIHHTCEAPGALVPTVRLADGSYALRYFAPWHGKLEDSGTGSVQACLAPLWLEDGQSSRVFQHGPQGVAEMLVRLDGNHVWLTGKVSGPALA